MTTAWDDAVIFGLGDCPATSLRWAALGYRAGLIDGRAQVMAALGEAGTAAARLARPILDQPAWDVILGRRELDHKPCPAKCRKCSRCIHSLAWWERGGRPFLGVEQERALVRGDVA